MSTASASADPEIAAAVAAFFHGGAGPTHAAITRVLTDCGYDDGYVRAPVAPGPNKEERVLAGFREARRRPAGARRLLHRMLDLLRHDGLLRRDQVTEEQQRLDRTLRSKGWLLSEDGELTSLGDVDIATGGREGLEEQLNRLRRSSDDPALLIGTAKELLESVAKYVLEESGITVTSKMDFGGLWHLARQQLGVLPNQVDRSAPGYESVRSIHQCTWQIAEQVNTLRNLQGTGHGRTLPTGVTPELAMLVVRETCTVADYYLSLLDRTHRDD